jgi:hypothetical protein
VAYLIFILITLALLAGFFVLTSYEERRGTRLFAPARIRLDERVARIEFILAHVSLGAFARDEIRRAASRIGHDIVNVSLQTVRIVERLLTRLLRYIRTRHAVEVTPRGSARPFVKTLSDFKDRLKATHPEISDIQ